MANEVKGKNIFLYNAPAGSGKTTTIKKMIEGILSSTPNAMILCITYTNRAADELISGFDNTNVQIQTIHSFISSFVKIYFSDIKIINLYFELYGDKIKERIANKSNKDNITKGNEKYKEKYGGLDYETIKANINKIKYNELPFNTLYYGGISHDDLLSFSKLMFDRFPIIKKRIAKKYQYIFIDEYQDTTSNVLNIFYQSIKDTDTNLYLFGDKMQQIYKNYDGTFEQELKLFDTSNKLNINYRSILPIIKILNKIYNDSNFDQEPDPKKENKELEYKPTVLICKNIDKILSLKIQQDLNAMKLFVFNSKKFDDIRAGNLYRAVNNMDKYGFGRKYGAVDVLTNDTKENPDELFRLLFFFRDIHNSYKAEKYGVVIQSIKHNPIFNKDMLTVKKHSDKKKLNVKLVKIFDFFNDPENHTIEGLLLLLISEKLIAKKYLDEILNTEDYKDVISISMAEFINLLNFLEAPYVSTQHGVKGEGYNSVYFISENSSNPSVKMYNFFDIWSKISINFTEFQEFYYTYSEKINTLQKIIGLKINELKAPLFNTQKDFLNTQIKEISKLFKDNEYYKFICSKEYDQYFVNENVTNFKKCLNINIVYGILSAYKLFYVGCSRAKERLTVFIDENEIKGEKILLIKKLKNTGFNVECC